TRSLSQEGLLRAARSRSDKDLDAQSFDSLRIRVGKAFVGNECVDQVEPAEASEGIPVHFCGTSDEIDFMRGLNHRLLDWQIGETRIGEARFDGNAGGRQEELRCEYVL